MPAKPKIKWNKTKRMVHGDAVDVVEFSMGTPGTPDFYQDTLAGSEWTDANALRQTAEAEARYERHLARIQAAQNPAAPTTDELQSEYEDNKAQILRLRQRNVEIEEHLGLTEG